MQEAKKRKPRIKTWGLSWGVPYWIRQGPLADAEDARVDEQGDAPVHQRNGKPVASTEYFSMDNVAYQTQWLKCINETTGIVVDYIGIWNERPYGRMAYTIALRKSLDAPALARPRSFSQTEVCRGPTQHQRDLLRCHVRCRPAWVW